MSYLSGVPAGPTIRALPTLTVSNLGMDGGFELQADLPGPGHEIKDVEVLWRLRGIVAGGGPNGTVGIGLAPVLRVYTEPHDATLVRTTFAAPVTFRRQIAYSGQSDHAFWLKPISRSGSSRSAASVLAPDC